MDENEWKESEQEEVDYRDLRVQAVQISEKEEDDSEKREDPGYNWEEGGGRGGGGSGCRKVFRSLELNSSGTSMSCFCNCYRSPRTSND